MTVKPEVASSHSLPRQKFFSFEIVNFVEFVLKRSRKSIVTHLHSFRITRVSNFFFLSALLTSVTDSNLKHVSLPLFSPAKRLESLEHVWEVCPPHVNCAFPECSTMIFTNGSLCVLGRYLNLRNVARKVEPKSKESPFL